jgi:hypothetical protein
MNTQAIYHLSLVTHIVGLTLMAGTTLVQYIIFKKFRKLAALDYSKGITILDSTSRLPGLSGIGIILLILSGVSMMAITHGAFGEQIWFRIKFGLVIIIIINGLAIGRRQGIKLRKLLDEKISGNLIEARLLKLENNIGYFHFIQLALFLTVFVLSVFKFN